MASLPTWSALLFAVIFTAPATWLSAQDLPKRNGPRDFDPEPKLMLNDLPDIPLPSPTAADTTATAPQADVAQIAAKLERAKKNAAWRERLYRAGVFAKVEAEKGALEVVRLANDLENARLQAITRNAEEQRQQAAVGKITKDALAQTEAALAAATAAAHEAAMKWEQAQRAAAELRLQRERKLLALGIGSRTLVKRAESALQSLGQQRDP